MPLNYLILGHSLTKRLQSWCFQNDLANLNLDRTRIQIYWHGTGGATIVNPTHKKSLWSDMSLISDLNIDVTFLDIGSNDLCSYHIAPETVAYQIIAFSEAVLWLDKLWTCLCPTFCHLLRVYKLNFSSLLVSSLIFA